ncbi:MAG: DNA gyrase subunit A, partial [Rhodobiaceae bacterium]|nr:DNA gyrase subunit A [Rhodobiaceae bacterium]
IPPHNLGEIVDAAIALIDDPSIGAEELIRIVPGPDFPTGGIILGQSGVRSAYETGRGSVVIRSRVEIEEVRKERQALVITEIPYQVNKASMIERIAELVREKRVEGISDIRDESDREGMRVVIELKRDAVADVVLNQLYRFSSLQTSFGCNMVALNGGRPEQMNLKDMLQAFVYFREHVISRRTKFLLNKVRDRAHILVGLAIAVANIDEVIKLIRSAPDPASAREALMARDWPARDMAPLIALIDDPRHKLNDDGTYRLSELQARAILDLRLQRLTALGRDEISDELNDIAEKIRDYLEILGSRARIQQIVKDEMLAVKDEFGTPRRTEIGEHGPDVDDEDLIERRDMAVTVSHAGYIKRVPLSTYRAQRRGGKGRSGMAMRDEDFVTRIFIANTHTPVLFFSSRGMVYKLKVWRLPEAAPQARGKALVNLLPLQPGEHITTVMPMPEDEDSWDKLDVMFATSKGTVRRNKLSDFVGIRQNGKIAMKLDEGMELLNVATCTEMDDVLLTTAKGMCIRFPVTQVRVFSGRDSTGVRGITLAGDDEPIGMTILRHFEATSEERGAYLKLSRLMRGESEDGNGSDEELSAGELNQERYAEMGAAEQFVLTVSENGYGKRTSSHEYRVTGRGGKGITAIATNERNGDVVASFPVEDGDQIMLVTNGGQLIRCPVADIRIAGRATQGVTIFNTGEDEHVVSVEHIPEESEDDGVEDEAPDAEGDSSESGE